MFFKGQVLMAPIEGALMAAVSSMLSLVAPRALVDELGVSSELRGKQPCFVPPTRPCVALGMALDALLTREDCPPNSKFFPKSFNRR
jgi:hypothetical protein